MWDFRDNEQHFCLQINSSNHPPPLENTCCKQNNVLMSLKPSICSMVIFSQADWYALSILFGILPALIKKKAQVITTCLYTHSCRHLPKDYWNETNDLNNNNCENRKKEEKKHFCFLEVLIGMLTCLIHRWTELFHQAPREPKSYQKIKRLAVADLYNEPFVHRMGM